MATTTRRWRTAVPEVRPAPFGQRYTDRWTIGTEESLRTFAPDAVRRFYADWYRPELMAVAAVGDFDPADVASKIKLRFPLWKIQQMRGPLVTYEPNVDDTLKVFVQHDEELTRSSVQWTSHIPWAWSDTKDDYRTRPHRTALLCHYQSASPCRLPIGLPSFSKCVVGRRSISAQTSYTSLSVRPNVGDVGTSFHAALTEIHRIQQHGFTDNELNREKMRMLRRMENLVTEQEKTPSRQHERNSKRHFVAGETRS